MTLPKDGVALDSSADEEADLNHALVGAKSVGKKTEPSY